MANHTSKQLDQCLPQTQCTLCQHDGCLPYAKAIANGLDDISQCHPGGEYTLNKLANLTKQDPTPWVSKVIQQQTQKHHVIIDPDACIGCTKCIQACPVDAIIGRAKTLHVVLTSECNGCDLCLPVCPTDCMHPTTTKPESNQLQDAYANYYRMRNNMRQLRLNNIKYKHNNTKIQQTKNFTQQNNQDKLAAIQAARQRFAIKQTQIKASITAKQQQETTNE